MILNVSPDNFNFFGLTQSVTPVLRLLVVVRVEIQIMKDHAVGCSQVDAQTTWGGGELFEQLHDG